MNHEIKLIGLDLDGTVFNDKKQISERNVDAISRAIEKGVIVMPATGRPYTGLPEEFLAIPGVRYALTANGSSVLDLVEQKVVYSDLLEPEKALPLLDVVLSYDALVDVFIEGYGYAPDSSIESIVNYMQSEVMTDYFLKTRAFFEGDILHFIRQNKKPIEKMQMIFRDMAEKERAYAQLSQIPGITITSALVNNIEINSATANKGNGLLGLGKLLGIERNQIMACGDSGNDAEMIKAVGLGVAMGNASDHIKSLADFITLTNEEDGVAHAIEKFVLS